MAVLGAWTVLTARAMSGVEHTWIPRPDPLQNTHTPPSGTSSYSIDGHYRLITLFSPW